MVQARKNFMTKLLLIGIGLFAMSSLCFAAPPSGPVARFEAPLLITTAGQSIDYETVKVLANRLKIQNVTDNAAKPEDLSGKKTLIVVPAHSNKGLGSAGTNIADEMQRVKVLLAAAVKGKIPVVLYHLGGEVRRSADSDPFIEQVMTVAKCVVVWAPGNNDGYFTKKCAQKNIPLVVVDKLSDLTGIMKSMFLGN